MNGNYKTNRDFANEFDAAELSEMLKGIREEIDKRKQVEAALRLTEEKFNKAFYLGPDPISISVINDGCYVDVNDAWLELSKYERHEVIGRSSLDIGLWCIPEDRDMMFEIVLKDGSIQNFETNFRDKTGRIVTVILSAARLDMGGEPHLLCVVKDISERKMMEEALRLSEERFSKAFKTGPVAMAITSLEDGRIIDVNTSACRMFGYSQEEVLSKNTSNMRIWLDPTIRQSIKQSMLKKESINNLERSFCKKAESNGWHCTPENISRSTTNHAYSVPLRISLSVNRRKKK